MKFKTINLTKLKLFARMMIIVQIFVCVISFSGCGWLAESPVILDDTIPNLDDHSINYLLFRDLKDCNYITGIDYYKYSVDGEFTTKDGETKYTAPIIQISTGFDCDQLDKMSYDFYLTKVVDMSIWGHFYPTKADIDELQYEFRYIHSSKYKFYRVVYIYSNSQLVGKVYYDTQGKVEKDWIENFLNDNLISMTVTKNCDIKNVPSKEKHKLSYLSIRNTDNSKYCSQLVNYSVNVSGGLKIEYGSEYYTDVVNSIDLDFKGDESINNSYISLHAEFYESKEPIEKVRYNVVDDCKIEIYSKDMLIGIINIVSEENISSEWIEEFLNKNLLLTVIMDR